ncbi:iron-sulfur cluster assembly scaffold protein [Desulfoplanes formicivorans]|uniref:Nitrogen fixation protein NifU n=1 Tax=Desulfoplanes formicivorans TaxID=1592317 RepID=A0A194AIK5_9BACT|nr:iron-sulfur cluster assembly scaffold protein [Desulfoplanes formicivorans]GAU08906.1 nitrogen fixation protein NifU [Desulfoplanes formicivorans]
MSDTRKPMHFWQDHSDNYIKMAFSYERSKRIENPDGYGRQTGQCGDTIELFLLMDNDRISQVTFEIDGCLHTRATANTVAILSEGRRLEEAWDIHPETVCNYLETLPKDHFHCAELAVGALYLALADVEHKQAARLK